MRTLSVALVLAAACRSSLEAENAALRARVDELERRVEQLSASAEVVQASARVVAARPGEEGIAISIGAEEGVRVGDEFYVIEPGKLGVRMEIESVEDHRAVGRSGDAVRPDPGDRVYGTLEYEVLMASKRVETLRFWLAKAGLDLPAHDQTPVDPHETLADRLARLRKEAESVDWLDDASHSHGRFAGFQSPIGRVLSIRTGDFGTLVVISVGADDKVRKRDVFHIRRGSTYVGMVRVDRVEANQAIGLFDAEFPGTGAPPREGDTV